MKKFLKYTALVLLLLVATAFFLPIVFKGKIMVLVQKEINKNLHAKVAFSDVDLSLFRHFPKLSIGLKDISVTGLGTFEKDTLISADRIDASVNIMSIVKGEAINIYGVYLESPRIHALVNKDGKANWEITKEDTAKATASEPGSFQIKLQKYAISNGYIYYNDATAAMQAEVSGLNHEGKGDFNQDKFVLHTKTGAAAVNFTYEHIPYLVHTKATADADFDVDMVKSRYAFKNAALQANELKVMANGFMQLDNDSSYSMDIKFDAPETAFKNILSLVPAIYKKDFSKLKTSGAAAFKGFVKGTYSPQQLPAYSVDLSIKDGFFQYPDLPQPVKNIQVSANVSNKDGVMDNTVVAVTKAHLELGNEPFDLRLLFTHPETKKYIDAAVKGSINLSQVSNFVKLDAGTKLSGTLAADAYAIGNLSALEKGSGPFGAGGFIDIKNLYYASPAFPHPVEQGAFKINIENNGGTADATVIDVTTGHIEIAKDPIDFTLKLTKPVTAMVFEGTAKGRFTLDNVKQFVTLENGTSIKGIMDAAVAFSGSKEAIDKKQYERINTTGTVNLRQVQYVAKDYPEGVKVATAELQFSPQSVALNNLSAQYKNTQLKADGVLNNVLAYALHNQVLSGTVNVAADKINLNDWMGEETAADTTTAASAPFAVPANINMVLQAKADQVQYDKVAYNHVQGRLLLRDETVELQSISTEALDGVITFNGTYSTKWNKAKPDISMSYNIKEVDIQKAFFAYNTFQKLMPVGKFLSGKVTSQFSMTGKLNGDMFPDVNSLTGNGNMLLVQGVLSKFMPLEKLASTLNVAELNNVSMKDIKSTFEFKDGKVLIKPFNVKVKEMDLQIGGVHGIDQGIDYNIALKVPRKYMGTAGNNLVNSLAAQATNKGIPVHLNDIVNLNVKMGGSITSPTIKTDLREAAGDVTSELKAQATAFVQQKKDSVQRLVKDSFAVVKKQVMEDVKGELTKQLLGTKDTTVHNGTALQNTKAKATETIKNTLGGFIKRKKSEK